RCRRRSPGGERRPGALCPLLALGGVTGCRTDERADAEERHVLLREPAVELAELRRGVLAAVHARDERAAGMVVLPLGEVVDLAPDDDPAVVERRMRSELVSRDGPVPRPRLLRLPEVVGDLPAAGAERLGPRAEVPRPQLAERQLLTDLARVERVDPGVIGARTLVVIEHRI